VVASKTARFQAVTSSRMAVAAHRWQLRVLRAAEITDIADVTAEGGQRRAQPGDAKGLWTEATTQPGSANISGGADQTHLLQHCDCPY